jgi:hypothetical protein
VKAVGWGLVAAGLLFTAVQVAVWAMWRRQVMRLRVDVLDLSARLRATDRQIVGLLVHQGHKWPTPGCEWCP